MTTLLPLVLSTLACVELPNLLGGDDAGLLDSGLTGSTGSSGDPDCDAEFVLAFPDAPDAVVDGCAQVTLEVTYEFDPDDAPEMRSYTVVFDGATETGFECSVRIEQIGVCGGGYYGVGSDDVTGAQPVSVVVDTSDCTGVEDAWEGQHTAAQGWVRLARVSGGDSPGDFSGEPLTTVIVGDLVVEMAGGLTVSGAFRLEEDVVAYDSEESVCYGSDGDEDDDGHLSEAFGGDDCDDRNVNLSSGDTWWADDDGDGYGDEWGSIFACEQPADTVDNDRDCDDSDRGIHPGADETCDGEDQDCDGEIDNDATDQETWYADNDGDGYGAQSAAGVLACDEPSGYADGRGDCDDSAADVNPGESEVPGNDVDEDCDGATSSAGIYAVQDGSRSEGDVVTLTGVIVTATSQYGFWVQEPDGGPFSGLWVYAQSGWESGYPGIAAGKEVTVTGEVYEYAGLTELDFSRGGGAVTVTGNPGLPSPEVVTLSDLTGSAAEDWEGVLVEIESVTVDEPDLGYGMWSVSRGANTVLVDDIIADFSSSLRSGSTFTAIAGVWHYGHGNYLLLPRDADDFSGFSY